MKKILLFLLAVAFGFSVYADGYSSYNMALELYKSGYYEEAKQRCMICVKHYPDDDLVWSKISQLVNDCDARLKEKAERQKEKAALMAKAHEEKRRKYEEQQRLRKERKLIYVSVNASTLDGKFPDFKNDIIGILGRYNYRFTNDIEKAYWTVYVSVDVTKLSKSNIDDPNHIIRLIAHYSIRNNYEDYIPSGGEGSCDAKGRSGIDYNKSVYNAYANLESQLGEVIHNAIENIYKEPTVEPDNVIAVEVSGVLNSGQIQTTVDNFMRVLQKYSKYKVVDRTINNVRDRMLDYSEIYSNRNSMRGAIGNDIHPRYVCSINVKKRSENDYYFSVHITDILNTFAEGTSGYPLGTQEPVTDLTPGLIYLAALYIITDLDVIADIVKAEKKAELDKEIGDYEKAIKDRHKKKLKTNLCAAGASLIVPGLGLALKGHNEGYAYLGAEAALCLGGVMVPELMRKSYINKRNNETNAHNRDVYTSRANACRKVSIISGTCAGLLHVANIVHSYIVESKYDAKLHWEFAAIPMDSNNRNDLAMGLSLTYRF
ncbi:MAG: DUF1682 domain-containing protein [Clostridia bacterium]|nr:DUF1682 domain-containing protein [Clostridia bacterium]